MRHSFVILFFFFHSNFRLDDSEEDTPLYNGYLFQRSREQESYQNQPGATQEYLTSTFLRRLSDLVAQSVVLKLTYLVRRVSQKRAGVQAGNMQKHEA